METDYRFEVFTDYSSGERMYVVKYIDFDHLIGVGYTIEDAIKDAQGNLQFYLEYCDEKELQIPTPSTHEDYDYSGKVTLRMPKSLHKRVDECAKQENVSINLLLNTAIVSYVSKYETSNQIQDKAIERIVEIATFDFKGKEKNELLINH